MKRYIILVDNYDEANSGSYIFDTRMFWDMGDARAYLRNNINKILSDHWTGDIEDSDEDIDIFDRILTDGEYVVMDRCSGQSLTISIVELWEP